MPIDANIPLGFQQANPMQSLSSVVQTANGVQQFRNSQAQGQALQQQAQQGAIDLQERQHAVGILKNIKKYQSADGSVDFGSLSQDMLAGAPTTGASYIKSVYDTQQGAASARKAVDDTDANERAIVGNLLYSLKGKSPMMVHDVLTGVKEKYPTLFPAVEFAGKYLIAPTVKGDQPSPELDAALDHAGRMFQGAPTQQAMQTPEGVSVSDNANSSVVSVKPGTSVPQGQPIPGTAVKMQKPPTATVFNNKTNAPEYVSGGQSAPALGQPEAIAAQVDENHKHYSDVQSLAGAAPVRIHLLNEIDSLAHAAATGDNTAWKAIVSKIAGYTGMADDKQTANDLMTKNLARLSTGSTDASRLLAQASNPGDHMTEAAIHTAVHDLVAQEKINQAAGQYFSGTRFDGDEYAKKRTSWNAVNPYEYAKMATQDRAAYRDKLKRDNPDAYKVLETQVRAMGGK